VTSKPDFKVMILLLVFMQLTRDLFAIAKFLLLTATGLVNGEWQISIPHAMECWTCFIPYFEDYKF